MRKGFFRTAGRRPRSYSGRRMSVKPFFFRIDFVASVTDGRYSAAVAAVEINLINAARYMSRAFIRLIFDDVIVCADDVILT